MEPWYRVVTPRAEVRQGRSFNPDEFAIALEQVVAGIAPEDYQNPFEFFSRTCFTKALREHTCMVLRRLAGHTENTSSVLTLITQFGGGKTHTLTALYHLIRNRQQLRTCPGIPDLLREAGLEEIPPARVAVFVGNAWDPQEGRETPWIDLARQLAGDGGVAILGPAAVTSPPGTEALGRLFQAAGGRVLILFDEVLNFLNRHRSMAEGFHAFFQNLTVAMTGTTCSAAVISLPRSQVEMTDWDLQWQDRITKVVRRVARDLIVNDETEISEVIRRRLFENLGDERIRKNVARAYADWCFERRAQLPPEWTAVDTATTEAKAREFLSHLFEICYPFHPATLSVFQRKWQALPHYQQTRGTLAMLAQWVSWVYREGYLEALREPLIVLGSAPLHVAGFRSVVLGQLGESRLLSAIDTDIAGERAHARALDADTHGSLRGIHRRVGTAIFFESSGGQAERVAHLPELRFALGGPEVDTTSIDNAALALERRSFFISRVGPDGFRVYHKATIRKAVNDRRASLDRDNEVKPEMRKLIKGEFERGAVIPIIPFPVDSTDIEDNPRLYLVLMDPETEWNPEGAIRRQIADWTRCRGENPRLYPGALIWCLKKPGRDLHDKVELWLAWKRVVSDIAQGILGTEYDHADRQEVETQVREAEEAAKDEVWASYRFIVFADRDGSEELSCIDLGAGHASAAETLSGRVITALKSQALLNESVGAGYIERNWPPALRERGAWPLKGLRQSFLNGTLTRLLDPDTVLRRKIIEFVERGDFGLASGPRPDGTYDRLWYREPIAQEEVSFDNGVFLLNKAWAEMLKGQHHPDSYEEPSSTPPLRPGGEVQPISPLPGDETEGASGIEVMPIQPTKTIRIFGIVPPEVWNRLGTRLIPKLRSGTGLSIGVEFTVTFDASQAPNTIVELRQAFEDLGLEDRLRIEEISTAGSTIGE